MTSWNVNYCGKFNQHGHRQHMLDPDADGNVVCSRPGCGHLALLVCTCRYDPDNAKYIGCPKHTENPRAPTSRLPGPDGTWSRDYVAMWKWLPEDMGGDLSLERADELARELRPKVV